MIINKKLIGHAIENSVLIISSLVLYELIKFVYDILKKKYPKGEKIHKATTLLGNIIVIFILDIIIVIVLDEYFNINIL